MPLTDYLTLGRSGLRVSPLCLGAMTFGNEWGFGASPEDSCTIIDAYIHRGGNFIDTANIYNHGHSETILGGHLAKDSAKRDRLVIATKFSGNMVPGDPNAGGGARKNIMASVEHSLRRLQTDYIDLYWMHFWDRTTPIDETMRALDDLVRSGKVRYIGFSDTPAWVCVMAQYEAIFRNWNPLIALQIEYSLLERTVEADLIPMAQQLGMGVTPWSPLKGGILTGKYTRTSIPPEGQRRYHEDSRYLNEKTFLIVDALTEIASAHGASAAQVALSWVQHRPGVASTIIGARTMAQLDANLAALDLKLTPEQTTRLDEASTFERHFPHDFVDMVRTAIQNGTSINGFASEPWPLSPANDRERY